MSNTEFAFWGIVIIGSIGLAIAVWAIWSDFRHEQREAAIKAVRGFGQRAAAVVIALVLASALVYADGQPSGACTEATLRAVCGDLWEVCWWTFGCYMLPG